MVGQRQKQGDVGVIIPVSSDGSWERSGGRGGEEKLWGAGYLLKVFGNEILHEDNWFNSALFLVGHGCTLFVRIYLRMEPMRRIG